MKDISVIIPCYNGADYIERCIYSIINQTIGIENIELILVDDNSTDNTWDIILKMEKILPDVIIAVRSPINGRAGLACNIGLKYASCEWIAYLDQDDWIEKDYLEKMYERGIEFDCDIVCCRHKRDSSNEVSYFDERETGKKERLIVVDSEQKVKDLSVYNDISYYYWGKLIKRSFLIDNSILFPEGVVYEDNSWGELIPFYVKRVYFIEEYLYHYYVNSTSTVLNRNSDYHTDLITVQLIFLRECLDRHLYENYKEEIEYNFLYNCYLSFLKMLTYRYETPNYSHFLLLKEVVRSKVPEWKNNRYIAGGVTKDFHLLLFEMIDKNIDRETFAKVIDLIREHGI